MQLDNLKQIIRSSGGGDNAIDYAVELLEKINRVESATQYSVLLGQLRGAREQGDFRGRVLELNFVDCFLRKGIALEYGAKQGMPGDLDFGWYVEGHKVSIELKLLRQETRS